MRISILLFGPARVAAGSGTASLELAEGATVMEAVGILLQNHAGLKGLLGSLRYAVESEYVESTHRLKEGDTLALIPPVAGG